MKRVTQILALGICFQFAGCQSQQIADIVGNSFKGTALEVGAFVIQSILDYAIPMGQA